MADFSSHAHGTFSWPELSTTDQKAGVAFYRQLFGWDLNEQPIGPTETYSMFQLRGKEVAAAYSMRPEERQSGIPPHWNSYVSVKNVDESVKRARELGANVLAPPFDVMDAGRMAVLQDPTGAVFQVWQPKKHIGAKILNEPGALCWTELSTRDTDAAEKFYVQLFGWKPKHSAPGSPMPYTEFSLEGKPGVGMMPMYVAFPPPALMPAESALAISPPDSRVSMPMITCFFCRRCASASPRAYMVAGSRGYCDALPRIPSVPNRTLIFFRCLLAR